MVCLHYICLIVIIVTIGNIRSSLLPNNYRSLQKELGNIKYQTPYPNEDEMKIIFGYNEDANLNFSQLTTKYGYNSETHKVVTKDGYVLTMFRILVGKKCNGSMKSTPVVLGHGLLASSDSFIITGTESGLAYALADDCYDVWCPNFRGQTYSRNHVSLNPDEDKEFWDFTFYEMGTKDLPAIIDYVLTKSNAEQINYIGHSQGTTVLFVMASELQEYNNKIKFAIALAPIAWISHASSLFIRSIAKISPEIDLVLETFGQEELLGRKKASTKFLKFLCQFVSSDICSTGLFILSGYNPDSTSPKNYSAILGHEPSGTSKKNLVHLSQSVNVDKFRHFDYGFAGNMEKYGTCDPPDFDVSNINIPIVFIRGESDWLSSEEDNETLRSKLPNVLDESVVLPHFWSHIDFLWSRYNKIYLFPSLKRLLHKYGY